MRTNNLLTELKMLGYAWGALDGLAARASLPRSPNERSRQFDPRAPTHGNIKARLARRPSEMSVSRRVQSVACVQ